jgi:hypothetical protein
LVKVFIINNNSSLGEN